MTKILLAEDDKSLREIYGVRLLAEGYDIVSAGDGEEAITMAINEQPDLIISDIMMPKISGFEMLDLLRTNPRTRDIRVIVMSALGGEAQRQKGEQLGADRYLVKSQVGIEDVVTVVHEVLAKDKVNKTNAVIATNPPQTENLVQTPPQPIRAVGPTPTQSPFNTIQATNPSAIAGVPMPTMPSTPPSVQTVLNPSLNETAATSYLTDNAPHTNMEDARPLLPKSDLSIQSLPPIPTPTADPAPQQPQQEAVAQASPQANPNINLPTSPGSVRIISPLNETLNPKVDIDSLLAKEEALDIAPNLSNTLNQYNQPVTNVASTPPLADSEASSSTIIGGVQIDENGAINIESMSEQESGTSDIFPTN